MKSEKEVNHMELVPWRPLRELTPLRREMEDLLKRFWGEAAFHEPFREEWIPAVDISETEDKVIIQTETQDAARCVQ